VHLIAKKPEDKKQKQSDSKEDFPF
jgi:hypothetical protein